MPYVTYGIQLGGAYLHQARVSRAAPVPEEKRQLTLDVQIHGIDIDRGGKRFAVVLAAVVAVPFRETALLNIECSVAGEFVAEKRTRKATLEAFARREAVLLLWPYLRAMLGQLGSLTGIQVPPLPIVNVLAMLAAREEATKRAQATAARKELATSIP
jgi:preprotein translocase subunit SecB